jgi:uncharacterized protein YdcH (DUF465 family)
MSGSDDKGELEKALAPESNVDGEDVVAADVVAVDGAADGVAVDGAADGVAATPVDTPVMAAPRAAASLPAGSVTVLPDFDDFPSIRPTDDSDEALEMYFGHIDRRVDNINDRILQLGQKLRDAIDAYNKLLEECDKTEGEIQEKESAPPSEDNKDEIDRLKRQKDKLMDKIEQILRSISETVTQAEALGEGNFDPNLIARARSALSSSPGGPAVISKPQVIEPIADVSLDTPPTLSNKEDMSATLSGITANLSKLDSALPGPGKSGGGTKRKYKKKGGEGGDDPTVNFKQNVAQFRGIVNKILSIPILTQLNTIDADTMNMVFAETQDDAQKLTQTKIMDDAEKQYNGSEKKSIKERIVNFMFVSMTQAQFDALINVLGLFGEVVKAEYQTIQKNEAVCFLSKFLFSKAHF